MEETVHYTTSTTMRVVEETQMPQLLQEVEAPNYGHKYGDSTAMSSPLRDDENEGEGIPADVSDKRITARSSPVQQQADDNGDDDMTEDDEEHRTALKHDDAVVDAPPSKGSIFGPYPGPDDHASVEMPRVTKQPAAPLSKSLSKKYASSSSSHKLGKMYDDEDDEDEEEAESENVFRDIYKNNDDEEAVADVDVNSEDELPTVADALEQIRTNQKTTRETVAKFREVTGSGGSEEENMQEGVKNESGSRSTMSSSASSKKRKRSPIRQQFVSVAVSSAPDGPDGAEESEGDGDSTRSESPTPIAPKTNSKSSTTQRSATKNTGKSASKTTPKAIPKPKVKATKTKATPRSTTSKTPASRRIPTASASASAPTTSTPVGGSKLKVVFSNSTTPERPATMKQFMTLGARKVEKVTKKGSDVLVVGNGAPAKTSKLLMAVALGKPVVRDEWIMECVKAGKFVDMDDYMPKDAFGIEWKDILGDNQCDRKDLFMGRHLLVTPALKKEYGAKRWEDLQALAEVIGFVSSSSSSARNVNPSKDTIVVGKETEDLDLISLVEDNITCYSKDLLSASILRGTLDDMDEYIVNIKPHPGKQAAKRRKSAP